MTGGFTPEYGNRFRLAFSISPHPLRPPNLAGHGDVNFRGATLDNFDLNADYGGQTGRLAYYTCFRRVASASGPLPSIRPNHKELSFDFGKSSRRHHHPTDSGARAQRTTIRSITDGLRR